VASDGNDLAPWFLAANTDLWRAWRDLQGQGPRTDGARLEGDGWRVWWERDETGTPRLCLSVAFPRW
jgi:hypothetical protein